MAVLFQRIANAGIVYENISICDVLIDDKGCEVRASVYASRELPDAEAVVISKRRGSK